MGNVTFVIPGIQKKLWSIKHERFSCNGANKVSGKQLKYLENN